jgi:peptidoglycan/LPS O-acetylase OafA/YrhL
MVEAMSVRPDDTTGGTVSAFAYQPALDGLRALAISGVLLFHAGLGWMPGGFLGVDAFFVLSGYLITSLLLVERARKGHIRLGAFWARRARRLLPALLVVLVTVVLVFRSLPPVMEVSKLRGDALSALGYVANWRMIYGGDGYFDRQSAPSPLQHTWSLGIEEQFYLLWPIIVAGLFALASRATGRMLAVLCLAGAAGSAVTAWLLFRPDNVNRDYFGTDTRAQALLVGCALAAITMPYRRPGGMSNARSARRARAWRRWGLTVAGMLGVVVLAWLWTHVDGTGDLLFHGGLTVSALAVAAVIAYVTQFPDDPLARVLSLAPVVWLGRISYGVYLWHWPLFAFMTAGRTGLTGGWLLAARLTLTLALATLSFLLVEEPIRRGQWPWPLHTVPTWRPRPLGTVASAVGLVAVTGFIVVVSTAHRPSPPATAVYAVPSGTPSASQAEPPPIQRAGRRPGSEPRIALFGDSVSWTLGAYLPPHPGLTVTNEAYQGCGIARLPDLQQLGTGGTNYPGCDTWDTRWRQGVADDDPDVSVVLLDRWELMSRYLGDGYHHVGEPSYDNYLSTELQLAVSIVAAKGAHVVLLTAPYTHRAERPDGGLYDEDQPERVDAWNRLLAQAQARDPNHITIIDLKSRVCPQGTFTWSVDGLQIRSDGLHFTPDGVQQWIAPWLLPQLAQVAYGLPPGPSPNPGAVSPTASTGPVDPAVGPGSTSPTRAGR